MVTDGKPLDSFRVGGWEFDLAQPPGRGGGLENEFSHMAMTMI